MKRLLGFAGVLAALAILPASHVLMAKGPKERVTICHIDNDPVPGAGFFITVAEPAVPSHLNHGDCLEADATPEEGLEGEIEPASVGIAAITTRRLWLEKHHA